MKKNIELSLLLVFIFFLPSYGQNPELEKDRINLKFFSVKFNVNAFYKNEIKTHKKSLELYSRGKTKEAFSEKILKNYKYVEKVDTLHIDDNKYLLMYNMKGMNKKDTLATFGNVRFQQVDMIANEKNEFQSLRAVSHSYKDEKKNFLSLKSELEKEFGNPEIFETNEYKLYKWLSKDLVFLLSLSIEKEDGFEKYYYSNLYLINREEYGNLKFSFPKIFGYRDFDWNSAL